MHATVLISSAGRRVGLIECFRRSASADRFKVAGARVHVSPLSATDVVRDKVKKAEVLAAGGVPVPWTAYAEADRLVWRLSLVASP